MANSSFDVVAFHAEIIDEKQSAIYVRITNANDFMPIAGWYKKVIGPNEATVPAIQDLLQKVTHELFGMEYLTGQGWTREGPPGDSRESTINDIIAKIEEIHKDELDINKLHPDGALMCGMLHGIIALIRALK
jgi:hypothetical protein